MGETIACDVKVNNGSSKDVIETCVSLVQEVRFEEKLCCKETKKAYQTISSIQYSERIRAHSRTKLNGISLVVPSWIPISSMTRLIKIYYFTIKKSFGHQEIFLLKNMEKINQSRFLC